MTRGNTKVKDAGPLDFEQLRLDRTRDELCVARRKVARYLAGVAVFAVAVVVIVVLTMSSAATEVKEAAIATGTFRSEFSATWLDPVVGLTIFSLMFGEALIVEAGRPVPWQVPVMRHICGAVTFAMMVVPPLALTTPTVGGGREWTPNIGGAAFHAVYPILLIGAAAIAPLLVRELTAALAGLRAADKGVIQAELDRRKAEVDDARRVEEETAAAEHARRMEERQEQRRADEARLQQERWAQQDQASRERDAADRRDQAAEQQRRDREADHQRELALIAARAAAAEREEAAKAAAAAEVARAARATSTSRTGGAPRRSTAARTGGAAAQKTAGRPAAGTVKDRTLAHLQNGPATKMEIADAIGASPESVKDALTELRHTGWVEQDPSMARGWCVTDTTDERHPARLQVVGR